MKIFVGQKFWAVGKYLGQKETTVTKVGNKWAYLDIDRRFNKETLQIDAGDYTPNIMLWESKEVYEKHIETERVWGSFRTKIANSYSIPKGITVEQICQAKEILFGDMENA